MGHRAKPQHYPSAVSVNPPKQLLLFCRGQNAASPKAKDNKIGIVTKIEELGERKQDRLTGGSVPKPELEQLESCFPPFLTLHFFFFFSVSALFSQAAPDWLFPNKKSSVGRPQTSGISEKQRRSNQVSLLVVIATKKILQRR